MRNAAAHFDDDFDLAAPARKKAPRRSNGKKKKPGKRFGFDVDMTKVSRYAAIGMSAVVGIGIIVNALMMQTGRHPAPLFGKSIALGQSTAPLPPPSPVKKAEAPLPAPKPAVMTEASEDVPVPATKPQPTKQTAHTDQAAGKVDPIARLLQGGAMPAAQRPADKPAVKTISKTVFGAQRALVKLGFVLKPNGTLGPQTKKAIEMFEKERHMPVTGELSRRVVKILVAESGMKIEN